MRRSDNHVATWTATSDNHVATSSAISDTHVCISSLISEEHVAMSSDLSDRQVAGRPLSFAEEARALLKTRHDALRARDEAYRAELTNAEAGAKRSIDSAANANR
jgi:Ca-activated chloride channel family protein